MIRKEVIGILIIVLMVGAVSGLEVIKTGITVNAGQYNNLTFNFVDSDGETVKIFSEFADENGRLQYTYSSLISEFSILLDVFSLEGEEIGSEEFGPYTAGESIVISYVAENEDEIVEDFVESDPVIENSISNVPGITGKVVGKGNISSSSSSFLYILGGVFIISALILFIFRRRNSLIFKPKVNPISVPKKNDMVKDDIDKRNNDTNEEKKENKQIEISLSESENKIKELEKELSRLRNKDKIKEIEGHIEREREEISRLMEGIEE